MFSNALKKASIILVAVTVSVASVAAMAQPLTLSDARDQGLVGERADGLIGIAGQPSAALSALVDQVNAARMAEYRKLAASRGVPVDAVQAIAGEEQLKRAASQGWMVMDGSGQWRPGGS